MVSSNGCKLSGAASQLHPHCYRKATCTPASCEAPLGVWHLNACPAGGRCQSSGSAIDSVNARGPDWRLSCLAERDKHRTAFNPDRCSLQLEYVFPSNGRGEGG